jgi:hypothetical protein
MKPIALDVSASCAGASKNYGSFVEQAHIQDVMDHAEYFEANRGPIVQNFLALALYDCTKIVFEEIQKRYIDGATPHTPN